MTMNTVDTVEKFGSIRKNSSTHTMLLVLKFYGKPVTFHEMREIAPRKITANNQRRCADILIERGFAIEFAGTDRELSKFAITTAGISHVYGMAGC